MCEDSGVNYVAQNGVKYNVLLSSEVYKVYNEDSVVEYNWDLWTMIWRVIRIL